MIRPTLIWSDGIPASQATVDAYCDGDRALTLDQRTPTDGQDVVLVVGPDLASPELRAALDDIPGATCDDDAWARTERALAAALRQLGVAE